MLPLTPVRPRRVQHQLVDPGEYGEARFDIRLPCRRTAPRTALLGLDEGRQPVTKIRGGPRPRLTGFAECNSEGDEISE